MLEGASHGAGIDELEHPEVHQERDVVADRGEGLVELRRELRVTKMENEILKRAAAYFARENVLPK